MNKRLSTLFVLGLALAPSAASAMELPVTYWVKPKPLKSDAPAGTMLTFELHQDSNCNSLFYVDTRDIDTVSLGIEALKLASVAGSIRPPKTVRINAVLDGVTPTAEVYLKVIGPGVESVGGDCQLQVSGVPGPTGLTGSTGPKGDDGFNGPTGPIGDVGPTGPAGEVGPTGPIGDTGPTGPIGDTGPGGADGSVGPTGANGSTGPAGATGPTGTVVSPNVTYAVFGTGPFTHYTGSNWVLETTASNTIRLRTTSSGAFLNYSIVYPSSCAVSGSGGTSVMSSAFRFSVSVGDTLSGTLCTEGSMMFVSVGESSTSKQFRCWKRTSNENDCQRLN